MIFFSDRKKLERKFIEWMEKTENPNKSNFNLITFLDLCNLFDEDKVMKFLEGDKNE